MFIFFTFLLLLGTLQGDKEYANIEFIGDTAPHDEYDAIDLKTVCKDNGDKLWKYLIQKGDTNKDSRLSSEEIGNLLNEMAKKSHMKEFREQIAKLDPMNSGMISFEQYAKDAFENFYDKENLEKDLESFKEEDQDLLEVNRLYKAEKERWDLLAGKKRELDHEIFYKFLHPEEFDDLKNLESEIYFKYFDTNKDGVISLNEYRNYYKNYGESVLREKAEMFKNQIDVNKNGQIELNEFKLWYMPSLNQTLEEERNFLFDCCDEDKDNLFKRIEVVNNCKHFANSRLTDYGQELIQSLESNSSISKTEL